VNLLRLVFHPQGLRQFIVNWEEVSHHLVLRAHRELGGPGEDEQVRPCWPSCISIPGFQRVQSHVRTIMTLFTPQDVTLQELRIETFFPADDASDCVLRAMAERST
jgi:hypothetical protein